MKHVIRIAGTVAALSLSLAAVSAAQQVSLTLRDGRVTLETENATARQILDEWARVGQAKVVNADKLTGPPMSLTLIDVAEDQALDTILRGAAGYTVLPRATRASNTSMYDRIFVMARTTPISQVASAAAARGPAVYQPPVDAGPADEPVAFQDEPPQPVAPVVNPYGNANAAANAGMAPGAPGAVGAGGANGTVNVQPPETRFDYTNPQAYFEQQRRAAQAAAQSGAAPPQPQVFNPYPGSNANPVVTGGGAQQTPQPEQPTGVPTMGTGTTAQPGVAPTPQPQPQAPPPGQGGGFNPYNMNPYNRPPTTNTGAPPTTPVQPDRSKYANPYVPSRTP